MPAQEIFPNVVGNSADARAQAFALNYFCKFWHAEVQRGGCQGGACGAHVGLFSSGFIE
jgi:hypothetical protein